MSNELKAIGLIWTGQWYQGSVNGKTMRLQWVGEFAQVSQIIGRSRIIYGTTFSREGTTTEQIRYALESLADGIVPERLEATR